MMARVCAEYLSAIAIPVGLSPIYYYPRGLGLAPLNVLAAIILPAMAIGLWLRRRDRPWTFFCAAWFALALLPESNLVPLAQLRADRFLYLPLVGAGIWVAIAGEAAIARCMPQPGRRRAYACAVATAAIAGFAVATRTSAAVWQSDTTAWSRVAARDPWAALAQLFLAHARRADGDPVGAAAAYRAALRLDPSLLDAAGGLAAVGGESDARPDAGAPVASR
jgi:hypothetical protein